MSIHNLPHKIKGIITVDKFTIMYVFIVILVGFSSFGLGRLSVGDEALPYTTPETYTKNTSLVSGTTALPTPRPNISTNTHEYIASKNSKLYYTLECSGAKRIKDSNAVYFDTRTDAEKLGYQLSSACK